MVISRLPSEQLSSDFLIFTLYQDIQKIRWGVEFSLKSATKIKHKRGVHLELFTPFWTPYQDSMKYHKNFIFKSMFFYRKEVCSEARSCSWIGACGLASTGSPGRNSRASNRGLPSAKKLFGIFASKTLFYFTTLK
jgi:hypothetical protein